MSSAVLPPTDDLLAEVNKRTKKLTIGLYIVMSLLIVIAIAGILALRWKFKTEEKARRDLEFAQFISDYSLGQDFVTPTVNTIQFLRRGYSITFDKVEYTQNGLVLSGQVGNATQLWVSSLALNFSARPYPYKMRDKWENSQSGFLPWWPDDWNIGTAQTTVGILNPGNSSFFTVTIPNVKQTPDSFEIAVSFSGERYQYLGR